MGELDSVEQDVVARIVADKPTGEQIAELLRPFPDERRGLILRVVSEVIVVLENAAAIEVDDQRPTLDLRPRRSHSTALPTRARCRAPVS